ncbi:MAG: S1 RNA-binding domain-containing protein [Spirochaetia bacterium]|nr:S1 RNA-binding domain-containing protein [Spirochaetota bacterium]MCX8096140.1 S1 RNA-binding domain-containing protein [Spirochaetota bacterium]MDW8112377.1 S1 RNA-binding domain-containing protein [Spirochaetia bacterium]
MAESFEFFKDAKIVEGEVVLVGERDVFIDCGFKSEVAVPINEFEHPPKVGERVKIAITNTSNGTIGSRFVAARKERIEDLKSKYSSGEFVIGKVVKVLYENQSIKDSKIKTLKGFLVDLGTNLKGFLPASHVELTRISVDPQTYVGKEFEFKIINKREGQFIVSRKVLLQEQLKKKMEEFFSTINVGDEVEGVVKKIAEKYIVLDIDGVPGLMSINDLSWKKISDIQSIVNIGDKMTVKVLEVQRDKGRIRVGRKQIERDPFEDFLAEHKEGDIVQGRIVLLRDRYGIVEISDGVRGLIRDTEVSWSRRVKSLKEEFKVGDNIKAKILSFDKDRRLVKLGVKQLVPDPWENIEEKYKKGQVVRGRVNTITDNSVFIGITDVIEGILRKEEVSWKQEDINLRKIYSKGQMVEALITKIDKNNRLLHLSVKRLEGNPWERFAQTNYKGSVVSGTVKEVRDDRLIVELGGEVVGYILASQVSLERGVDHKEKFKVGDTVNAMVMRVVPSEKIVELSIKALEKKQIEEAKKEFVISEPAEVKKGTLADLLKMKGLSISSTKVQNSSKTKSLKTQKKSR